MEQYLSQGLIIAGILLMTIELLLLSFATLIILFFGAGFVFSGLAVHFAFVPMNFVYILASIFTITGVLFILFWRLMRRFHEKRTKPCIEVELLNKQFILDSDVNIASDLEYKNSELSWKVRSAEPLLKGTLIKVIRVELGVLWVSSIEK